MLFFDKHRRARRDFSAYIDGELTQDEARKLDAHLDSCARCRAEVDELRSTSTVLRNLPEAQPRRSFALTPEMVAEPSRPAPRREPPQVLVHGTRMAAAGLAAALAIVFVIDLSDSTTTTDNDASPANFFAGGQGEERGDDGAVTPDADQTDGFGYGADGGAGDSPEATSAPADGAGGGDVDSGDPNVEIPTLAPDEPQPDGGQGAPPAEGYDEPTAPDEDTTPPEKDVDSASGDGDDAADDAEDLAGGQDGETASGSPSAGDGDGFDTLLALEIGLGSALGIVIVGAAWATLAARRQEL